MRDHFWSGFGLDYWHGRRNPSVLGEIGGSTIILYSPKTIFNNNNNSMIFSLDSMIEFWTLRNLMFLLFLPHDGLHKVFNSWNYKHRCPFMYYKNVKMS